MALVVLSHVLRWDGGRVCLGLACNGVKRAIADRVIVSEINTTLIHTVKAPVLNSSL